MIVVKAITNVNEYWGEEADDFLISYQVDVGLENILGSTDMFSFEVISTKRLSKIVESTHLEIGRGLLIMNDYDHGKVVTTVERIINLSQEEEDEETLLNISKYFRWDMDK
ncbi:Imm8 family immunity protein [Brevibacillus daliensis]|uniref:Imm8 family immunity protein n=1 Tax=Brevibacillus daliensis TaxID=2892995 RepID=UPI001E2D50A5|nr:Imm8 family immunity protein [Brevibacillus daliensis]